MGSSTRPPSEPWIPGLPDNERDAMDAMRHFAAALPGMSRSELLELSTSIAAKQQALASSVLTSTISDGRIRDYMGSIDSAVLRTRTDPATSARGRASEGSRPSPQPVQRRDHSRFAVDALGRRVAGVMQRLEALEQGVE